MNYYPLTYVYFAVGLLPVLLDGHLVLYLGGVVIGGTGLYFATKEIFEGE